MRRSRLATSAGIIAAVGLFGSGLGAALAHFAVLEPVRGFALFALGLLSDLIAGVLGLAAFYATRAGTGRSGRSLATVGIVAALAAVALVGVARRPTAGLPAINDFSTDLTDPPAFPNDPSGRGRDMAYPAGFAEQVEGTPSYRDLRSRRAARPAADVLREAEAAARALEWQNVAGDPAAGIVTASETSKLFRFVDDVVIRVRDDGAGGSLVDVRSKSRDGRGVFDANAARIRRFLAALPK